MTPAERRLFTAELRAGRESALRRLRAALRNAGGSVTAAAQELGIPASTLYDVRAAIPAVRRVFDRYGMGREGAGRRATAARLSSEKDG